LNFPSSVHLKSPPEIEKTTLDLLNEVQRIEGIIIGITEDMPEDRWQQNCVAIMDGIERHAKENPHLYAR
jgi:DNA-binding FrmR family transcriptional regulator